MIENTRNFCIIAHIDHGKSTLADRFLEITNTVPKEKLYDQYLDKLSLERERGITIKMQPVRMEYKGYVLNLIDTPGHEDFSYEVSRALTAVEGAILLIDGTKGIQAQTIAHFQAAKKAGLTIIPAINKIDLQTLDLELLTEDIKQLVGETEIFYISAKFGTGVQDLLRAIIEKVPPPRISSTEPKALIFDSHYNNYWGIIAHVKVFSGEFRAKEEAYLLNKGKKFKIACVGFFDPELRVKETLKSGEIGFIATGIREPGILKIGDTCSTNPQAIPLEGYKEPLPVVFASLYPKFSDYELFKENIEKLNLTDPSVTLDVVNSPVFGKGYLAGFSGLLHLDIFTQRLKREFGTDVIITLPSVKYKIFLKSKKEIFIENPQNMPDFSQIDHIEEPWAEIKIITPLDFIEEISEAIKQRRGIIKNQILETHFLVIEAEMPIEELISGFHNQIKSISSGYASLSWTFSRYVGGDFVKLDILIAETPEPSLSKIVIRERAEAVGRKILLKLKELLPREQYPLKLQAAIGSRIIARETIPALRKDVAGWLYGGDRTRKMKLWQKQKEGKKKLESISKGHYVIPNDVLINILGMENQ